MYNLNLETDKIMKRFHVVKIIRQGLPRQYVFISIKQNMG